MGIVEPMQFAWSGSIVESNYALELSLLQNMSIKVKFLGSSMRRDRFAGGVLICDVSGAVEMESDCRRHLRTSAVFLVG